LRASEKMGQCEEEASILLHLFMEVMFEAI
jgi:hypothetical protein